MNLFLGFFIILLNIVLCWGLPLVRFSWPVAESPTLLVMKFKNRGDIVLTLKPHQYEQVFGFTEASTFINLDLVELVYGDGIHEIFPMSPQADDLSYRSRLASIIEIPLSSSKA